MGFFTNILLRIATQTGFTTKGSNLTNVEVDTNFLNIANEINNRDIIGNFETWTAGTVEQGEIRIYDSKLWLALTNNAVAPTEGSNWTRINEAKTSHQQNTDVKGKYGDTFEINYYSDVVDLTTIPSPDIVEFGVVPSGFIFFATEVGVFCTEIDTKSADGNYAIGTTSASDLYDSGVKVLGSIYQRERTTSLSSSRGTVDNLVYKINSAATATTLEGRFYAKGFLVAL